MRIAIVSDIHDHVWNLQMALNAIEGMDALVCCGDLCSPFVMHQIARGFTGPIHVVFGNNDGDQYRLTAAAAKYPHVSVHGELFRGELGGKRFAAQHYDGIGRLLAASGEFDVVCFGHNHIHEIITIGETLAINPGSLMGCQFGPDATRTDVEPSFVIYDTDTNQARTLRMGKR